MKDLPRWFHPLGPSPTPQAPMAHLLGAGIVRGLESSTDDTVRSPLESLGTVQGVLGQRRALQSQKRLRLEIPALHAFL